jgi:hypothetical protein
MDTEQRENLDADVVTPVAEVEQAPVEMTPEDVEAEEELTANEAKWQQEFVRTAKEWKESTSVVVRGMPNPEQAKRDISHVNVDKSTPEDVRFFHAFEQVQKNGSLFYKDKFEKMARERLETLSGKFEDPAFCLARVLEALRDKSTAELKDAA